MTGRSHLLVGTCSGFACGMLLCGAEMEQILCTTLIGGISSLLPDIDEPTSKVGRRAKILSVPINKMFKHRGLFHTPIFALGLFIIMSCVMFSISKTINFVYPLCFLIGYLSHLFLDTFTPSGIMWLYPFYKKRSRNRKRKSIRDG